MFERSVILLIFGACAVMAVFVWRWWLQHRTDSLRQGAIPAIVRDLDLPAVPAILYFTTPACSQCKYQQTPILQQQNALWGSRVHIRKLDAVEHGELAGHFGVMTVPTTVVLDAQQGVIAVNHGLASVEQLREQVAPLFPQPDGEFTSTRSLAPQQI